MQLDDQNKLQPVYFASFRFNEREQRQSITFQELLGCVMALKYFHKYIAYNKVILRTDHRPIVHLFKNAYSDSQTSRMMTVFERYDLEIQFKPGKKNTVADYLSRAQTVNFKELDLQKLEEYADDMSFPTQNKPTTKDKNSNINKLQLPHITHTGKPYTEYWQRESSEFTVNTETEENDFFQVHKQIPQLKKNIHKLTRESSLVQAEETRQSLQTESEGASEGKNPSTAIKQKQLQRSYADTWVNDTQTPKASLIQHQKQDTYFEPIYKFLTTGILPENPQKTRFILIEAEFYEIRQGLLYRISVTQYAKNNNRLQYCIALPKQYVDTMLELHHKAGHYSTLKMFHTLRDKYYFPKMRKSIDLNVSQCPECQQYKNPRNADRQYITPTELPQMLSTWSVDLKGHITAQGTNYKYILVAVEHVTRYMELCPLVDCTTNTVMQAFYDTVILCHGKPRVLQLDKSSYFTSETMKTVAKLLGCELQYRHSYIHHSNSRIETMITNLATNFTPHFLMYGREYIDHFQATFEIQNELTVPQNLQEVIVQIIKARDTALETLKDTHRVYSQEIADRYNKKSKPVQYSLLQPVYLKAMAYVQGTSKALTKKWLGPYYIREFIGSHAAKISSTIAGEVLKTEFHLDLLKPAHVRHLDQETQAITLENLDPHDVPRFRLEIPNMPTQKTTNVKSPNDQPLDTDVSNKAQVQTHKVDNTPELNTSDSTKPMPEPTQRDLYEAKPTAKRYEKGSIWLLFPHSDPSKTIWKHIKQCKIDRAELDKLPWCTRAGRVTKRTEL